VVRLGLEEEVMAVFLMGGFFWLRPGSSVPVVDGWLVLGSVSGGSLLRVRGVVGIALVRVHFSRAG
jgi:hypothetical protein